MKKHTFTHKSRRFRRFLRANRAVSALEYAILVGVVSVGVVAALGTFGSEIGSAIEDILDNVNTNTSTLGTPAPF